jgi:hypothetical protein
MDSESGKVKLIGFVPEYVTLRRAGYHYDNGEMKKWHFTFDIMLLAKELLSRISSRHSLTIVYLDESESALKGNDYRPAYRNRSRWDKCFLF